MGRILRPKRNETGELDLIVLHHSPNVVRMIKSRRLRWAGYVARMEEDKTDFKILIGKPIGRRSLGRPRSRWEDNIKIYLKGKDVITRNCVDSAQVKDYWRAFVNVVLKLRDSKPWS